MHLQRRGPKERVMPLIISGASLLQRLGVESEAIRPTYFRGLLPLHSHLHWWSIPTWRTLLKSSRVDQLEMGGKMRAGPIHERLPEMCRKPSLLFLPCSDLEDQGRHLRRKKKDNNPSPT
jgi:hypothetical protein